MPTNLPVRKLSGVEAGDCPIATRTLLLRAAVIAMVLAWLLIGIETGVLQPPAESVMLLAP